MAKLVLSDIDSEAPGWSSTVNTNSAATEAALENTLSRDGSTPNSMGAALDLNSNKIINTAKGIDPTDVATMDNLTDTIATTDTVLSTNTVAVWVYPLTSTETGNGVAGATLDAVNGWRYRPGDPRRYSSATDETAIVLAEKAGFVLIEAGTTWSAVLPLTTTVPVIFNGGVVNANNTSITFSQPTYNISSGSLTTTGSGSFAFGHSEVVLGQLATGVVDSVVLGQDCSALSPGVAIGDSVAILTTSDRSVAIGNTVNASDTDQVLIGTSASGDATSADCIAIGTGAGVVGANGIAIGKGADSVQNSVAIGNVATTTQANGVIIGFGADSTQPDTVVIGRGADATGTLSVTIGTLADCQVSSGTAVGYNTLVSTAADLAIGANVEATASGVQAFGASEDAADTTRLGPAGNNLKFGVAGAVLADGDLDNETFGISINEAGNTLTFKVKYSTGVVKSGTVALT